MLVYTLRSSKRKVIYVGQENSNRDRSVGRHWLWFSRKIFDAGSNSTTQPVMKKATVKDIVDAVLYLAHATHVSGEILHVDGAAPARRW